ncbi:MAG: ABC transporter permease [Flavobacteriaceae bacterium]
MLINYLKVAFRNIFRHKLFSLINIFGLSISMATCLLIILLIYGQKKADNFHSKGDRIVRVLSANASDLALATTPLPLGSVLLQDYPHIVENTVRIKSSFVGGDVVYNNNRIPLAGRYVDASFFDVFDFKMVNGNSKTALTAPFSIVITIDAAQKLFGDENPIGKSVKLNDSGLNTMGMAILEGHKEKMLGDFTVTGVVDTSLPSHIQFQFLIPMSTVLALEKQDQVETAFDNWEKYQESYLYVLLMNGKTEEDLSPILEQISKTKYATIEDMNIAFSVQALSSIALGKWVNSPISLQMPLEVIYFLSFLGLIVLFSAGFNYVNLSFARSLTRAKEVGVRKVIGAARRQLFVQFLVESILVSLVSLVIAVGILQILSRVFLNLWINQFIVLDLTPDIVLYALFVLFSILVGLVAGLVPASFLSSFSPIKTLRSASGIHLGIGKRMNLRKFLVIVQFSASLFFIITTLLIFSQLNYQLQTKYGFDQSDIINVKLQGIDYKTLSNEFEQNPSIQNISASSFVPGTGGYGGDMQIKTLEMSNADLRSSFIGVDQHFIPNLKLQIQAGHNFPESLPKNDEQSIIVNEAAARLLGYQRPKDIVGETIMIGEEEKVVQVIGLVKNFIFDVLMEADKNDPLLIRYLPDDFKYMNVRYDSREKAGAVIGYMEHRWKALDPIHSFKYEIYEDELKATNAIFSDVTYILGFISFLTICISCLGLLGMAAYSAESKKREIGIRKVHGAEIKSITLLLSNGFLKMFAVAIVVTVPIAYLLNSIWLEEFSYHVDFSADIIFLGIGIMLLLGFGTILSQTIRAASAKPIKSLRTE